MRKIFLLFFLSLLICSVNAQSDERPATKAVDVMPQFPGGANEMASFIAKNYEYPAKALKEGLEGKIMVAFVVDKKGVIGNVTIDEGSCDAEAVRVMHVMLKQSV